jgi:hypothetical protein
VTIFDACSRIMRSVLLENQAKTLEIDVVSLPNAIYFVRSQYANGKEASLQKLVVIYQ